MIFPVAIFTNNNASLLLISENNWCAFFFSHSLP